LRSPELASHPLVVEFLKTDHSKVDPKIGMKEFSKKLIAKEQELTKISSYYGKQKINNGIYRVTSYRDKISMLNDLNDRSLLENYSSRDSSQKGLDEKGFVLKYDQQIVGILALMNKFQQQINDLKD
jgi:hypothetical protein